MEKKEYIFICYFTQYFTCYSSLRPITNTYTTIWERVLSSLTEAVLGKFSSFYLYLDSLPCFDELKRSGILFFLLISVLFVSEDDDESNKFDDLNVEHLQLLLFLFHALALMQKKQLLLFTANCIIKVTSSNYFRFLPEIVWFNYFNQ